MHNLSIALQNLRALNTPDSLCEIWKTKSIKEAQFALDHLVAAIGTTDLLDRETIRQNEKSNQSSEN